MGDTERQLDTRITETAEGLKQTSKDLQDANGKITEFKGQLESTARGLKTEYEKYTNDAIGQISDSSLNLIRNSAFQNKDDNFAQWQNVSAKANIREDGNGLRWVELTQSGMTTDNPQGITSNYFVIKQGKVTVAVDIKLGDKANLDNQNILLLELYNDNKQRVDFTDVSVSQLGLSTAILNDHNVHRGLYRLGIDRKDVKYMTVKAILHRNGDLWLTNFSARLSSIDDGGYTPNPDDVNQQILKQNTKIEQDAKQIALKANSVDVTRDIKSAVQNSNGGGINLIKKSSFHNMTIDQVGNTWSIGQGVSINPKGGTGSAGSIIIDAQNIVDSNSYTEITQSIDVEPNNDYTFSLRLLWGKAASGKSFNAYTFMVEHTSDGGTTSPYQDNNRHIANSPSRSANTYTVHTSANTHSLLLYIRAMGGSYIELEEVKLERGPVATPWTPNSQDTSEEIKSAKDAAIKVASDQINIHVNELSTSFDDKLNKRVNEAKTASEKFTSDGIEQTVKKITDVKNQVDDIQIGGVNVLHNTDPTNEILSGNITANSWVCASGGNGYGTADPLGAPFNAKRYFRLRGHTQGVKDFSQRPINWKNSKYTFSIYARLDPETGATSISAYIRSWSIKKNKEVFRQNFTVNSKEWEKFTFTFDASTFFSDDTASFAFGISGVGSIDFAEPMLVTGTKAMDWAPNPDDVSQTMSLDSANIDNLRSQGHYFVHSLTGNPLGSGWVYVDVIGNNSDRIRQDVYQDNGNKHMYRRLFGTAWSGWEQGAYLSDVNNVKTEVTASVKNLGDRVTTEVNSITSRVNSNNGGGINLQVGTDDCSFPIGNNGNEVNIENYSGTTKMFHAKKGGFYSSYNAKSFVPTPGETYTLSADVKGNGIISGGLFRYEGGDNGNLGTIKLTNDWQRISNTVHINKVSGQWVFYIRDSNDFYVKHIKIERGSVATPWSPAPEDTAETIKTLNTKWDVANGQIQGKVTETDVNNILNGKGYATQSWAESNFRMKSDSIDLEVKKITDPISNKLNNLQVGTRNLLHNTSDQWRTLTNNNGWLQQTTSSSCWTSVADYHGGDKFTYAAKITNNSHQQAELEGWLCDQNKNWINGQAFHAPIPKGANAYDVSVTFPITADTWYIRSWIIFTGGQAPNGDSVKVKDERLVEGATPGSWSPNPDDINQQITNTNNKIDTQTLDSANIDQMKTQGHYFVKNLTGNPIGGWVYVDVTGNNNDRIRQDVYADQSYVHKFRSWNGSRWTDWEEEVKNTDIISKINISPENIRLSSNKIEIDGNTYIHGELNVPNVKLNGNNGSVDLSGDGIHIGGPDGDIKLDSGGIDITKSGQGLSITGDYIQVVTDSNGQKEITGLIGSNFNLKNKNQNGLALLVTPQQELGRPYGGDLLTIGELEKSGEVTSAVTFDATNITGDGSGFHWTAPHYLHGPAQAIHIENTQDNLTLLPLKMPNSFQEGYYQPALTTTHGVDGNGNWVQGDSGIEFLWNSVKPYGAIDMTDADILMKGANGKLRFGWAQHDKMWNNQQKFPALYRLGNNGGIDSGIAFAWGSTWDLGTGAHNITSVMMNSGA